MATNVVYKPGQHLPAPVPAGTLSGAPLRIGSLNAIAITDRAKVDVSPVNADGTKNATYNYGGGNPDGYASVWTWGGHRLIVKAGAKPNFGDGVYFDPSGTPTKLTVTAGSLALFGAVESVAPIDNGDGTWTCVVGLVAISK